MDDVKPPTPRNFDDVTRPGSIPAAPSSNPVIVGNQTVQTDPMMAAAQPQPMQPTIPVQPPMSTREMPLVASTNETSYSIESNSQDAAQSDATALGSTALTENVDQPPTLESVHKISHDQAFFGQMKPPKSKFKKFLIFILVLLIMAGIGYGAWYVLNTKKEAPQPEPVVTTPVVEKPKAVTPPVPDGYVTYTSEDSGYTFNYPKEYGEFVKKPPVQTSTDQQSIFTLQSSTPTTAYGPGITGPFVIQSYTSKDQTIESRKYGPTIQLKNGKWIVITANEADTSKNKVGDEYLDFNKKVISSQNNGDLTVYTLLSSDEGSTSTRLVFVSKDSLQVVTMPNFSDGTYGAVAGTKENATTSYDTLVKNVTNSIFAK